MLPRLIPARSGDQACIRRGRRRLATVALLALAFLFPAITPLAKAEESLGNKIKRLFEPTPPPKKKRKASATKKKPSATPSPSPARKKKVTPEPSPSPSPKKKSGASKKSPSPSPTPEDSETPTPTPKAKSSPSPSPKAKKKKASPTPEPSVTPSPTPEASPDPEEDESATPAPKKSQPPGATISASDISGYDDYPLAVRQVIDTALALTARNLDYKYGSADPDSGGLDCSGFVYFVLTQHGVKDVPRDASGQYSWVRKAGNFQAVISRNDSTFELEEMKPGDLLFWTGTYAVEKDPPITHAMIYLGREKTTKQRIMVGASDGRTYHGESRYGVGVFDFKLSRTGGTREGRTPTFVGYGPVPGL